MTVCKKHRANSIAKHMNFGLAPNWSQNDTDIAHNDPNFNLSLGSYVIPSRFFQLEVLWWILCVLWVLPLDRCVGALGIGQYAMRRDRGGE